MGPRVRQWIAPTLVVVALAVVFGVVLRWWAGFIIVALAVAMLLTVKPRTAQDSPKETKGRQLTKRQLARLEGRGHRVLHDRAVPGSDQVLEHLVVGPTGIYLLDSEKWDRFTPVRAQGRDLYSGPSSRRETLVRTAWQARRAGELIGRATGRQVEVVPTVVIHGPTVPWTVLALRGVRVLSAHRLTRYLREGQRRLTLVDVERISSAADAILPPWPA